MLANRRGGTLRAACALVALVAAWAVPVSAGAIEVCELSGLNGTYQVGKMVLPAGSEIRSMAWYRSNPIEFPFTSDRGYSFGVGLFIVDASHTVLNYMLAMGGSNAPYAVVRVDGTTYYEARPFPNNAFTGTNGGIWGLVGGRLPPGTFYIVGFGWGPSEGLLGEGRWAIQVRTGVGCPVIEAPGEVVSYHQGDFQGPTHLYTPLAGAGSGLSLTLDVPRNTVLGLVYASVKATRVPGVGWVGGRADMRFTTPTYSGRVGNTATGTSIKQLTSIGGSYRFVADYFGAEPLINVTFLQVDLP